MDHVVMKKASVQKYAPFTVTNSSTLSQNRKAQNRKAQNRERNT
jgi:hypothetical protein